MKRLFILSALLFFGVHTFSQNCDFNKNSVEADHLCDQTVTQLLTGNATIIARDAVILKPGFEITTTNLNGKGFNATTNHSIVAEPASYATTGSGGVVTLPEYTGFIPATLGGVVDVSPTGAATYQIPIQVSPGSNGMQPNLSIVYSSQSGNGLLGMGWNLSGLSAITRVNKNQYYDNTIGPITLTSSDVFSLDGARLISNSAIGEYSPENNPYVKVVYNNDEFTVTTQDGTVSQYGATSNSKFKAVISTTESVTHTWALNRTIDPNGNYIDYIYSEDAVNGEYRISEIRYTGNVSGKAPYNSVKFYYDLRNDPSSFYIAGHEINQTALLTGIKVFCEGSLSKHYEFDYSYNLYSKLNRVTLTADGVKYAPTVINWETPNNTPTVEAEGYGPLRIAGDFNGDGRSDWVNINSSSIGVHLFGESTSYFIQIPTELPEFDDNKDFSIPDTVVVCVNSVDAVDLDGDEKDELVVQYTFLTVNNGTIDKLTTYPIEAEAFLYTYRIENNSLVEVDPNHLYSQNGNSIVSLTLLEEFLDSLPDYKYYYADLNNDGADDKILIVNKEIESVDFGNGEETKPALSFLVDDVSIIDFDGDGGLEIVFFNLDGKGSIWKYNGSVPHEVYSYGGFCGTWDGITHVPFYPGDFNGDGKTDYLTYSKQTQQDQWFINYSTGISYISNPLPSEMLNEIIDVTTDESLNVHHQWVGMYTFAVNKAEANLVLTADINNDGRSDITFATANSNLLSFLSNGTSFTPLNQVNLSEGTSLFYADDVDNDGQVDFVSGQQKISYNLDRTNTISSISDGLGNQSTFTYSIYTDYTSQPLYYYPVRPMRGPLKLVSNLTVTTDADTVSNVTYTYSEGYQHQQGLGFLGFSRVESSDVISGLTSQVDYLFEVDGDTYNPWVDKVITTKGGKSITQSFDMMIVKPDPTKKPYQYVPREISTIDEVRDVTTVTENTYDAILGRLTKQVSTTGEWSSTTDYVYEVVNGNTSHLLSATTATTHADDNFTSTQVFGYDTQYPFRVNKVTAQGKVTNYTSFDAYGNVTGASLKDRDVSGTFDSKGRFMESLKNVQGLTSKYTYRYSDGMKMSETNPNGLTVTHSVVPAAGVLTVKTTNPDGNIVTNTLGWSNGDGTYFNSSSVTNGNTTTAYYNSAGQPVRKTVLGFEGAQHYTDYSYNSKGLLYTEQTSGVATPTTYLYDDLGRIESVTGHNDLSVSYTYGTNTVTTTNSITGTETKTFDAAGNITSLVAPTGTIEYSYFASGNVKQLITEGAITQMTYDDFGNQLSLTEPNTGTTSYTYNEFNELLTQVNAKGTTEIKYKNGLIDSITGPDHRKVYKYYSEPGKKGLLKSISRGDVVETYNYDNLCRLTSTTVTDGTNTFTTTQQFNSKGQVEQTAYPTGLTTAYTYDIVGNLKSITDVNNSNKAIWTGVAKNERDDWTSIALGNGLSTTYEYSPSTYLLSGIKTGIGRAPQLIQNLGFTFNTKGQLEQRTEGTLTETFSYDDMNRLTREKVTNGYEHSMVYQNNGNIETATAAGVYTYLSSKPHAVETVTGEAAKLPDLHITTNSQFTSDGRISLIENGAYKNTFTYGPSGMRFKVDRYEGATKVGSKIYVGNSEFLLNPSGTIDTARTMVYAPTGICAVYEKVGATPSKMFYILTDYLGSWLTITNESAQVTNRYSYDAWGRPRNPNTWEQLTQYPVTAATLNALQPRFGRGYTGHEHMASFGLINMNGRVYDPYLQRFISPDPHVTDPSNPQNYNRYSYCLNNPLMYTDPSGYDQQLMKRKSILDEMHNRTGGAFDAFYAAFTAWNSLVSGEISAADYNNLMNGEISAESIAEKTQGKRHQSKRFQIWGFFGRLFDRTGWGSFQKGQINGRGSFSWCITPAGDAPSTWHGGSSMSDFAPYNPDGLTASNSRGSRGDGGGSGGGGLPDWNKTTPSEKIRYILEAGAASQTKQVNVHRIFKNFSPETTYGMEYGINIKEPVTVTLGGETYKVWMSYSIYVNSKTLKYNPILNLQINSPVERHTKYGKAMGYNYGHTVPFYLLIYDLDKVKTFEKWYGL